MKKATYLLAAALFFVGVSAQSQETKRFKDDYNTWSVGLHGGNLYSFGDGYGFLKDGLNDEVGFDFGFGINVNKEFNHVFGLRLQGLFGTITGGKVDGGYGNSSIADFTGQVIVNFGNLTMSRKATKKFNPYINVGLGINSHNPTLYQADGTEFPVQEESTVALVIPIGIGVEYKLSQKFFLDLNTTYRSSSSDLLDGFSSGRSNDAFMYTSLGVGYMFGSKEESVEWVNPMDQMYMDLTSMQTTVDEISKDSDGDGVADMYDAENNTPAGVSVDGRGRALDVDGDGIPDHVDQDPFTPKGATVTPDGREADSDGDGVPDSRDREPNTPAGELVNFQGISIPSGELNGAYLPSIYFAFESSSVTYANYERLASVARALKMNPKAQIRIVGHADKTGSADYNDKLATARAQAVADHLNKYYGIQMGRMEVSGKGFNDPLADGQNKINRRVDFEVK